MLQIIAGAALGALATLSVTWWLNRNSASRAARRETYLELLTMLHAALRVQQLAVFDHTAPIPDVIGNDKIDQFNARLEIDASAEVREHARAALRLLQRFNVSHLMRTPIEIDEVDLFRYRFDLVRGVDDETARLHMRMSLGKVNDELRTVVDQLSSRVRRELHGGRA